MTWNSILPALYTLQMFIYNLRYCKLKIADCFSSEQIMINIFKLQRLLLATSKLLKFEKLAKKEIRRGGKNGNYVNLVFSPVSCEHGGKVSF